MHPVPSSCALRRSGQLGLDVGQHAMIRIAGPPPLALLYFIDNVTTTGNTLYAARAALGWGEGVVFADGATKRNPIPPA